MTFWLAGYSKKNDKRKFAHHLLFNSRVMMRLVPDTKIKLIRHIKYSYHLMLKWLVVITLWKGYTFYNTFQHMS